MCKRRVLLVQCCHLAQFFYIADKLRHHHPEWDLQALFDQPTNVSFYQKRFPYFSRVHCLSNLSSPGPDPTGLDQVVLPLLSRGYWQEGRLETFPAALGDWLPRGDSETDTQTDVPIPGHELI